MTMRIINTTDKDRLYCAGSFSKFTTSYVCLSLLAENYKLDNIIDDIHFLDKISINSQSKSFLALFQKIIGSKFSIRDLCSHYTGLPYTYDLSEQELESVELGNPFKHHSIPDEKTFLYLCTNKITPVYTNRCKFHYSEIGIIFLGYLIEKIYDIQIESLYQKYILDKFSLTASQFSRTLPERAYVQDLSDKYDYPSIAILNHGYFCYSNGFYTTLNDTKILLENLLNEPVFQFMTDLKHARAASNRLLNGLSVEIRLVGDDIIYGYEGLSFSGCNIWAYSTKNKLGYIAFTNDEDAAYPLIYDNWGYTTFDIVPEHTQQFYLAFLKHYDFDVKEIEISAIFQGKYHRVKINEKELDTIFHVGNNFIVIRNPDEIKYDIMYANRAYRIKGKDNVAGGSLAFYEAVSGNKYMLYDGTLYVRISAP